MSQSPSADGLPAGDRPDTNRRKFIRGSSLLLAGALPGAGLSAAGLPVLDTPNSPVHLPSTQQREIKLGLIGCGYRGLKVASSLLASSRPELKVSITALADAFPDRLQQTLRALKGKFPQHVAVDGRARCLGLQGYRQLLECDVDLVLLATPPSFRPQHFEASVAAGKHVYAEKPIAIDMSGVQRFQSANNRAQEQGLVVGVGLPRRFHPRFQATVAQLRRGAIGTIVSAQALQSVRPPSPTAGGKSLSEMDVQLRNWTRHTWASGGPWIEPHVQNLDVINWLLGAHPLEARPVEPGGLCGQPALTAPQTNNGVTEAAVGGPTAVEFLYAGGVTGGVTLLSHCQIVDGPHPSQLILTVQGTQGHCDLANGKIFDAAGRLVWRASSAGGEGDLLESMLGAIADNTPFNQGADAIEATLTSILGRTASQRGQPVGWHEIST